MSTESISWPSPFSPRVAALLQCECAGHFARVPLGSCFTLFLTSPPCGISSGRRLLTSGRLHTHRATAGDDLLSHMPAAGWRCRSSRSCDGASILVVRPHHGLPWPSQWDIRTRRTESQRASVQMAVLVVETGEWTVGGQVSMADRVASDNLGVVDLT